MAFDIESREAQEGLAAQQWLITELEKLEDDETLRDRPHITPVREWLEGCGVAAGRSLNRLEQMLGDVIATDLDGNSNGIECIVSARHPDSFALSALKLYNYHGEWFAFLSPDGKDGYETAFVRREHVRMVLDALEMRPGRNGHHDYKLLKLRDLAPEQVVRGVREFHRVALTRAN